MSNTLKFGDGKWAVKEGSTLAYNDENGNFKPLPFTFDRSTSATRVNKQGLIETVSNNEPRIDFLNDSKGALKLEPSRSNLLPYSVDYSQDDWAKSNVTLTSDFAVAPDGTNTASKILATASDSSLQDTTSITSGTTYTFSVYLKTTSGTLNTNISLGSPAFPDTEGDGGRTKQIIVTNTWQRFTITSTADATANSGIGVGGFISFSTGEEVLVWGAQLEEGSYPTSYIPTQGSISTRVADACSQIVPDGIIGQTEGTLFYDGYFGNEATEVYLFLQNGASSAVSDSIYLQRDNNAIAFNVYTGATLQSFIVGGSFTIGQRVKIAAAYKANDFVLYVNGVQIGTDNTGSVPTCDTLQFASYRGLPTNAEYINVKGSNQAQLYNTRLSNAELQALTTI